MFRHHLPIVIGARLVLAGVAFVAPPLAVAEQPRVLRHYRTADGLAHDHVRAIHQDAKGYLWIGTGEGVSRFDGYHFVNYGVDEGLETPLINDIATDGAGHLWVATNGAGIARFIDEPAERARVTVASVSRGRFITFRLSSDYRANQVNALVVSGDTLWCATDYGLFQARVAANGTPSFKLVHAHAELRRGFVDHDGGVWFGSAGPLLVRLADNRAEEVGLPPGVGSSIRSISGYGDQVVIAADNGVYQRQVPVVASEAWTRLPIPFEGGESPRDIARDSAGSLWIATSHGLFRYRDGRASRVTGAGAVSGYPISTIIEDREHTLWVGTEREGLLCLGPQRFASYTVQDGLPESHVVAITEGPDGTVHAATRTRGWVRFVDDAPIAIEGSTAPAVAALGKRLTCERSGRCFALTGTHLYRFSGSLSQLLDSQILHRVPTGAGSLSFSGIGPNGLYRDPNGVVWFGTTEPALYRVSEADTAAPRVERIAVEPAMAPLVSDRSGTLWLANFTSLARLRGSRVERIVPDDGRSCDPRSGFVDSRGRLWVGLRYGGVLMTADPAAERPDWVRYSTSNGLASNSVWAITEDAAGRIYFATNRALDRLDPASGRIRHFTTSDGLPGNQVNDCFRDREGTIWVATSGGVARLESHEDVEGETSALVYVSRVDVGSASIPLPDSGAAQLAGLEVGTRDAVVIEFVGLRFRAQDALRYQYRLHGVDGDWSAPTADRTVTYARLGSGTYTFMVRAIDLNGTPGVAPATVEFTVLPPFWRRWWFVAAAVSVVIAAGVAAERQRARRLRITESLRRQVAMDLHDDVGSGLSQIAIMSEVLQRQANPEMSAQLRSVAGTARSLREAMSDIIWAIDPRQDRMSDLVERMRQSAFTLIDFGGLRVEFQAPAAADLDRITMAADRRRQLLLIFKEAVTNVARHAKAGELRVHLAIDRHAIHLSIEDDGSGFDPATVERGQGLESLGRRATALRGSLRIESRPGTGTRVHLRVPTA